MNPDRGEAPLPGTEYTLRFTLGALRELEAGFGPDYSIIGRLASFESGKRPTARELDALLDHGLRAKHGRVTAAARDAAVQEAGGIIPATQAILKAVQSAFGDPVPGDTRKKA